MKNVCVIGAAGRMGRTLVRCLQERIVSDLKLVGAVEAVECAEADKDAGLVAGIGEAGIRISCGLQEFPEADVFIDFSSHQGTAGNAERISGWRKAMVIGTTGLTVEEKAKVERAAKIIPIVMAPNMSVGVNLLLSSVEKAAAALKGKGYDVEVIERHHRRKKDAPSGTALAFGEAAARGLGWDLKQVSVHGRQGLVGERPGEQIGFHAVRGGDIIGDHTVLFATDGECIEFSHRATTRDAFAVGALSAAAWVAGRKPGLYSMRDVLAL